MSAAAVTIADDITAEINDAARSWAGRFTAERVWYPTKSLDSSSGFPQLTDPVLSVIPDSVPTKLRLTRGTIQLEDFVIFLVLQAKVTGTGADGQILNADVDPLIADLEAVTDWFFADGHKVGSLLAKCMEASIETYCDRDSLDLSRCYVGCASLTFKAGRP